MVYLSKLSIHGFFQNGKTDLNIYGQKKNPDFSGLCVNFCLYPKLEYKCKSCAGIRLDETVFHFGREADFL